MKRSAWFRLIVSAAIAAAIIALAWAGLGAGVFGGYQLRLTDALFPSIGPDPRIVIVAVDDRSLAELGRWPFERFRHGDLIDRLSRDGAALIGYDITFSERSATEASDRSLGESAEAAGNVIFVATAGFSGTIEDVPRADEISLPIEEVAHGAAVAHANIIPDPDGVVRALPPVIETPEGDFFPGLSLLLYEAAEGISGPITLRPEGVQVGGRVIPTGRGHLMDVNFAAGFENQTYSFADVVEDRVPEGTFEDKIVIVGATALGLGDQRLTPLDKATGEPGVFVHANALNTMLQGAYLVHDGRPVVLTWVFGAAFLVAAAVGFLRIWLSPILAGAFGVAYFMLAFVRFDGGTVMNLVYPPLAIVLAYLAALAVRYFTEERERRRVTRVFGRYVAGDVVEEVLAAPERALATLEGASRELTILFADLRGFTSASDGAAPKQVVTALNAYLDAMVRAVNEELGTIDKFMGDCVMAFWGAPRPSEHHAERAVRAGIRMLDYIDEAVREGKTAGLNVKGCGVGVSTGEVVVGNIGSSDRLDYTVIGDRVNVASRLCGVAGAGEIVIGEHTAELVKDRFRLAALPPLVVKGKAEPLRVYQALREGQEAAVFEEGATLEVVEEKGHFEPVPEPVDVAGYKPAPPEDGEPVVIPDVVEAPTKAAGYAPIEHVPDADREE